MSNPNHDARGRFSSGGGSGGGAGKSSTSGNTRVGLVNGERQVYQVAGFHGKAHGLFEGHGKSTRHGGGYGGGGGRGGGGGGGGSGGDGKSSKDQKPDKTQKGIDGPTMQAYLVGGSKQVTVTRFKT